jgi:hypothetical protein
MRRKAVIVITSLVAALATGAILTVSGGAQSPGGRTVELVTKNFRFKAVDNPPRSSSRNAPPGTGDTFVISALVTDRAGARLGDFHATCSVTRGGRRAVGVCEGIYALTDGEIHLLARLDLSSDSGDTDGSVVGGTRAYAGARGTFASRDRPGESGGDPSDDTLTLLP